MTEPAPSRRPLWIAAAAALTLAFAARTAWRWDLESTDDAQIDADVAAVQTRVAGVVAEVRFTDDQRVRAGDVLVVLDDKPLRNRLAQADAALAQAEAAARVADASADLSSTGAVEGRTIADASVRAEVAGAESAAQAITEAEASLTQAEARLALATRDADRQRQLFATSGATAAQRDAAESAQQVADAAARAARARLGSLRASRDAATGRVDQAKARARDAEEVDVRVALARAQADAAHAQVEIARAAREQAALDLSYATVTAPADGVVSQRGVVVGQVLGAGSPIASLVHDGRWVVANFKETQVGAMQAGQRASVWVDAFPGVTFEASVESMAGATGSQFALLPPDNASGNFTKVVQRVPVRLHLDAGEAALRPGMNVTVEVDTGSSP